MVYLDQGWGTCGLHEHWIWPASEFFFKFEHTTTSKWSSMERRCL